MRALRFIPAPEPERGATAVDNKRGGKDPLVGTLVGGRFRVERLLANGGMGRVYVARHEGLQRRVALKVVHHDADPLAEREGQLRFRVEAEMLGRLVHPNIVTVHDFGDLDAPSNGRSYLAMELLDGPTLAQRMDADTRLPLGLVLELAEQMVDGLRFAHAHGIVHRDMKPSNVVLMPFLQEGGAAHRLKIIDFGTGKLLLPDARDASSLRLTKEGYAIGTPEYMAPEQLAGRPCAASDLFAVGVIMFEALTGVLPFAGVKASRAVPPRLRGVAPDLVVPDDVEELVFRLLSPAPADRPTSNELLQELRRCIADLRRGPRQAITRPSRVPAAPRSSRRLLAAGTLGVLATLVLLLAGIYVSETPERPSNSELPRTRTVVAMPRTLAASPNAKSPRADPSTVADVEPTTVEDVPVTSPKPRIRASSPPPPPLPPAPAPYTEFKTTGF